MFFVECTHHGNEHQCQPQAAVQHLAPASDGDPSGDGLETDEDQQFGLKPMNCPGHCLIFASTTHSWRELPVKYADFSPLHRHEASGALRGLTRLRRCVRYDGVDHEVCAGRCPYFLPSRPNSVSHCGVLGFPERSVSCSGISISVRPSFCSFLAPSVVFSTRPENYMGRLEEWDEAERVLSGCLAESKTPFELNPGDGAFYGPKIGRYIGLSADTQTS